MSKRKIGVIVESFRLPIRDAIAKAAEVGADGIQFFCSIGDLTPEKMSGSARKDFRKFIGRYNLELASICADYFAGFMDPSKNDKVISLTMGAVDLAVDLGATVLTSHIGTIPEDESSVGWKAGIEALTAVSEYAGDRGVRFGCETGPERPDLMRKFLDQVKGEGIAVNFDPANLVMNGFDHMKGVELLAKYIVHTHAKDGVRVNGQPKEVPLGEGSVDFPLYLAKLDDIGFEGFLTIEREVGTNPAADVEKAVEFLRGLR